MLMVVPLNNVDKARLPGGHSVKVTERRYIVARVKPYLIREAKTLATRWKARDFDHVDGPEWFIKRLP